MSPPLTMMRGASLKEARDFHIPQLVKHLYHARELVVTALSHWGDGELDVEECFNVLNYLDSAGQYVRDICRCVLIDLPPSPFGGIIEPFTVVAHRRLLGMVCEFCTGHWCFHFDPDAEYASLDRVVNCIDHMLWQCEDLPKSCVPCRVKHARKVAAHLGKTYSESAPWLCVGNSRRRGCDDLS